MRMRLGLVVGAVAGYVFGAKAGRERYEDMKSAAQKLAHNPIAERAGSRVQEQMGKAEDAVVDKIDETVGAQAEPEATTSGEQLSHVWTEIGEASGSDIEGSDEALAAMRSQEN